MTDDERGREEKIAKAIYYADSAIHAWEDVHSSCHDRYRTMAIAAMREGEQKCKTCGGKQYVNLGAPSDTWDYCPDCTDRSEMEPTKQEGEARAAGDEWSIVKIASVATQDRNHWKQRAEAAESLAKAEREQRESEGVAYRGEIEQLREAVQAQKGIADMACEHAEAAETREFNLVQPFQDMIQKIEDEADQLRKERDEARRQAAKFRELLQDVLHNDSCLRHPPLGRIIDALAAEKAP